MRTRGPLDEDIEIPILRTFVILIKQCSRLLMLNCAAPIVHWNASGKNVIGGYTPTTPKL